MIAVEHWQTQFRKHATVKRYIRIVRDPGAELPTHGVVIIPFSLISKHPLVGKRLRRRRFDLVVIDECHALMSLESERTRSIYAIGSKSGGVQDKTPVVILLSATPSPSGRPGELYPHLRALRPDVLGPAQDVNVLSAATARPASIARATRSSPRCKPRHPARAAPTHVHLYPSRAQAEVRKKTCRRS